VADVFKLPKNEVTAIETFVLRNDPQSLDIPDFMIVNNDDIANAKSKRIQSSGLNGSIIILRVQSADLYFMRYTGDQEMFLNGLLINIKRIYLFPKGSFIRIPKGKPMYYTDVVSHFLSDSGSPKSLMK
jgi:ABC transport system ATP-binding/permease protein